MVYLYHLPLYISLIGVFYYRYLQPNTSYIRFLFSQSFYHLHDGGNIVVDWILDPFYLCPSTYTPTGSWLVLFTLVYILCRFGNTNMCARHPITSHGDGWRILQSFDPNNEETESYINYTWNIWNISASILCWFLLLVNIHTINFGECITCVLILISIVDIL